MPRSPRRPARSSRGADTRRGTILPLDPGCRSHRGELRRAGAARIGRQREADRARPPDRRSPSHPQLSLLCDGDPALRNGLPHHGRPGAQLHDPPAPRRRRADLTLESAAVPFRPGRSLRPSPPGIVAWPSLRAHTADRQQACRTDPGGGHSARRRQYRARPRGSAGRAFTSHPNVPLISFTGGRKRART